MQAAAKVRVTNVNVYSGGDCSPSASTLSLSNNVLCRICRESNKKEDLFSHCQCKGSVGLTHTSCLLVWIKKSGSVTCEICKQKYVTIGQINKRFWQWRLPRIGTKGWFKLILFTGFLFMLIAFTAWMIWSRTSSSVAAKQERNKKQIEYSYLIYGMLVLIAIIGMYALSFRPFLRFMSRCLVMNQSITVIPNGELCKEEASSTNTLDEPDTGKTYESKKHSSCKHESLNFLKNSFIQMDEDTNFGVRGYTKLPGRGDISTV